MLDPGSGNTSEALNLELRINDTAQDSIPGIQRFCCMANPILEEPYALMWARTGLWEPWVATPRATWPAVSKEIPKLASVWITSVNLEQLPTQDGSTLDSWREPKRA
jgi:hypothetical protein